VGMYDTILYECEYCGKEAYSQTKILGNNTLAILTYQTRVSLEDCILALKNSCEHCSEFSAIQIKEGEIVDSCKIDLATMEEGVFGAVGPLGTHRKSRTEFISMLHDIKDNDERER